jgi:hypothetical protein
MRSIEPEDPPSVAWHASVRAQAAFGFYDSAYQIVLLSGHDVDPHVVVDHEMAHVNLVINSSLGLLERIFVFLAWKARESANLEALEAAESLLSVIISVTEIVHEGTAWFGTELQSEGRENLRAPARYAAESQRLRSLFATMPDKPFTEFRSQAPLLAQIADDIAIYALSPPAVEGLWSQAELITAETLRAALKGKRNDPLMRFREICSRLDGIPFPALEAWSRTVDWGATGNHDLPLQRRGRWVFRNAAPIPAVLRADLYKRGDIGHVLRKLADRIGLRNPTDFWNDTPEREGCVVSELGLDPQIVANWVASEPIIKAFSQFEVTHGVDPGIDRYSQVCILESSRSYRELIFPDASQTCRALSGGSYLTVVLAHGSSYKFTQRPINAGEIIVSGPIVASDAEQNLLRPTWHADFAAARTFLRAIGISRPIIAGSIGYDFAVGDYAEVDLLKGIPHVVIATRDFRSLWFSLGKGLAGSLQIEWRPMPSPSGHPYFGFLLLKPSNSTYPIVINAIILSQNERVVSVADRIPSSLGVQLVRAQGNPYAWMGAMTQAVMTAAAIFENGSAGGRSVGSGALIPSKAR